MFLADFHRSKTRINADNYMKKANSIFMILLLTIMFNACEHKDYEYMGEGVLTGYDPRDCACCGGLVINLNSNSTDFFTDSTYQIDIVPDDFDITSFDFPVLIKLDYERNGKLCGKTIDILKFERK
jgi:hypothetical protein